MILQANGPGVFGRSGLRKNSRRPVGGQEICGRVAGDAVPARYVRLVAVDATADRPLIVGELRARADG